MKAFLARTPIGVFAFSEDGQLISYCAAASVEEGMEFVKKTRNPISDSLSGYELVENESAYRIARREFRRLALETKFKNEKDLVSFLNEFGIKYSMSLLSTAVTRDKVLIQAANALDDLTRTTNIFAERLWEWFSLHYPEANRRDIVENVARFGNRKKFPNFNESLGIELKESDERMLQGYAIMAKNTLEEKKKLEKYIAETAREIMPNFSGLVDPLLAARFLSLSGSLEKLARMPASTIQLLGAEKALFRHLKQQGKSPKFGVIFQDGRIQSAPEGKRGKIARIISSKLMQAARIDFYSGRAEPRLKSDLEKELRAL